jgi:ADP-heptose:LPS heptosyltransferase
MSFILFLYPKARVRILLVRLSALGDVITGLHVLSTVRARVCSAQVGWLVEDRFAPLLEGHPHIDNLHVYERRRYERPLGWPRLPGFIRSIRKKGYDLALDLQGNLKSGVLTRLSGAGRRMGLGGNLSREGNHLFVKERIDPTGGHRVDDYFALLDAAVGEGDRAPALLPVRPTEQVGIVLHPGVSRFGAFKRWPEAHFAELGDRLAVRIGAPVVLTAGPGERGEAEAIQRDMQQETRIVEPESLRALADLLAGARLVVASDTGPAHIAAACGVPTLTLFGPKDPAVMAPVGSRARALAAGVRCSPCPLRWCPDPVCMSELSVDQVERSALELLGVDG